MGEINNLIAFITKHWGFDEQMYPELKGKDEEQRLLFALRHSALHFAKTAGKIAAISEDADHGDKINFDELKQQVPKALINVLRLAELLHLTEKELLSAIEKKYHDKINSGGQAY